MVYVHDRLQESSPVDLLEVGMGSRPGTSAPFFFLARLRFRIFFSLDSRSGEKKLEEKKIRKQVERNGSGIPQPQPDSFFCLYDARSITCLLVCVSFACIDSHSSCAYESDVYSRRMTEAVGEKSNRMDDDPVFLLV
jgi:hypothetical protein